jgi:hypothetical protein
MAARNSAREASLPIIPTLPTLAPRQPGSTPPVIDKPSPKEHTEAEWEAKRELIRKLYIGDHRKLSETMAILEAQHGFAATEQMYKKRLKKWNIRKRAYRKVSEDPTASVSPTVASEPMEEDDKSPIEEVVRQTPPSRAESPLSLVQLSRPESFARLEIILGSVFSWSQNKIESSLINTDPMSKYLAMPNKPPIEDSRTMYRMFELVFDLWKHGRGNLAGMAAGKGFYALEYVLTDDHPDLIWHILDTVYDMVDKGHLQLLRMFLEHATFLSRRQLPANHPLLMILQQLSRCDYQTEQGRQQITHLLRKAWLRNVDVLGDQIGSLTPQHLWLYEQLIWDGRTSLRRESDLGRKRDSMYAALEKLAARSGPSTVQGDSDKLRVQALMLEFTQMDLHDMVKAEELAHQLLQDTQGSDDVTAAARSNDRFHAYARKMLARVQQERSDWAEAEQNLRLAIAKREAAHGTSNNIRVVRDMWVLASYFQRVGRFEEADQVISEAINRAQKYIEASPG